MRSVVIAIVLAAAPALAQPAPAACDVTISRAPDEVRAAVAHWLAQDTRCSVALDLRVVPTDGGYYVLARDNAGRIRERVVPDAQSAGVLVASWAADDGLGPAPLRRARTDIDGDGFGRPSPDVLARPPGLTTTSRLVRHPDQPPGKWIGLEAIDVVSANENGTGLRADIDLARRGPWALGATASVTSSHDTSIPPPTLVGAIDGSFAMLDVKALAYASGRARWGGWHARAAIGAGFVYTSAQTLAYDAASGFQSYSAHGVLPTAEAAVLLGHSLGQRVALEIGSLASVYQQTFHFEFSVNSQGLAMPYTVSRDPVQWGIVAGLQYRL